MCYSQIPVQASEKDWSSGGSPNINCNTIKIKATCAHITVLLATIRTSIDLLGGLAGSLLGPQSSLLPGLSYFAVPQQLQTVLLGQEQ